MGFMTKHGVQKLFNNLFFENGETHAQFIIVDARRVRKTEWIKCSQADFEFCDFGNNEYGIKNKRTIEFSSTIIPQLGTVMEGKFLYLAISKDKDEHMDFIIDVNIDPESLSWKCNFEFSEGMLTLSYETHPLNTAKYVGSGLTDEAKS